MVKVVDQESGFGTRSVFKQQFGLADMYDACVRVYPALTSLVANRSRHLIDRNFVERLMLATTEVNGCEACSHGHTRLALQKGFTQDEIDAFLSGDPAYISADEATAILFAQHYADTKGRPDRSAYDTLVAEYGADRSRVIVSAVQVIQAGNVCGLAYSAFQSRLKSKPYANSTLGHELAMQSMPVLLLPVALVHALARTMLGRPRIQFE
ncbi:MAG: carboxymuconolactone decarboxylase family protein [Candidatus Nanopelagicales bacterium]